MKSLGPMLLGIVFFSTVCVLAGTDTNIIAMSDWSDPVSLRNEHLHDASIRGRLLIVKGHEPAYGGNETNSGSMTFVELQDVTGAYVEASRIYFDVMNLRCQMSDASGKPVPAPNGGRGSGRGPFPPVWLMLPYNSTIRLYVNGGSNPLNIYPTGEPGYSWSIPKTDTNTYYLTGTLKLLTATNHIPAWESRRNATLIFPKFKVHPLNR
jgi:hypothetical protein